MKNKLLKYYRVYDWWDFIIPPIIAFYFIGILSVSKVFLWDDFLQFFLFIILTIHTAMFGFSLGEYSDLIDDYKAGKRNALIELSNTERILIVVYPFFVMIVSIYFIRFSIFQYVVFFIQILCFVLYSIEPFRLKRKKFFAVFLDAIYSGSLFYLLALMNNTNKKELLILVFIWGLMRGVRNILSHLIKDRENDVFAEIETFATAYPIANIKRFLFKILIPLEYITINIMLYFFPYNIYYIVIFNIYILYTLKRKRYIIPFIIKRRNKIKVDYISSINGFFESVIFVATVLILLLENNNNIVIILITIILFPNTFLSWFRK